MVRKRIKRVDRKKYHGIELEKKKALSPFPSLFLLQSFLARDLYVFPRRIHLPGDEAIVMLRAVKTPPASRFLRPWAWSPSAAFSPTVAALRQTLEGLLLSDDEVDLAEKTRADELSWAAFILRSSCVCNRKRRENRNRVVYEFSLANSSLWSAYVHADREAWDGQGRKQDR